MLEALVALMRMIGHEPIQTIVIDGTAYGRTKRNGYYRLYNRSSYRIEWIFEATTFVSLEVASAMAETAMLPHQDAEKLTPGAVRKFLGR